MEYFFWDLVRVPGLEFLVAGGSSFLLIFAAEMGDKSQLVCMVLAARNRSWPVLAGSATAFGLLNALAVIFGVAIAGWIPEPLIFGIVALLFLVFGIQAMRAQEDVPRECTAAPSSRSIFLTTFMLIFMAEFGDKTQLAVVGLSSTSNPLAVWTGATLALITTSALGVWAGCTLLQRIPVTLLHRISGVLFLMLALFALYRTYLAIV